MMGDERETIEITAPSVEEAIEQGAAKLGVAKESLYVEILEEGGRSMFGLSSREARVRLTVLSGRSSVRPAPRPRISAAGSQEESEEALRVSREIVEELIERMGVEAKVTSVWATPDADTQDPPLLVEIHGDDLSILIGRHGETLAALQYIARLIVGKELQHQVPMILDVEGYRARRERQLRQLAQRMAEQAVERGQTMMLEPMPANERRIIHIELRDNSQVSTESVGEGEQRKVTIIPRP
jgi:spoIIIJ-associated protein